MKVKIQEYIRNEKYYIIPTNEYNQYIGMHLEPWSNIIRFDMFEYKNKNSDYLTPDIKRQFILSLTETEVLLKTMTMLWNESKKERPVHNRTFNIRCYGDYKIRLTLTKAENHLEELIIERVDNVKLSLDKFSIRLTYSHSKGMYYILKNLLKNKKLEVQTTC